MQASWRQLSDGAIRPTHLTDGERMWLRVLGPTAWCVLHLVHDDVVNEQRTEVDLEDVAQRLGMNPHTVMAMINALIHRGVLYSDDDGSIIVPVAFPLPSRKDLETVRGRRRRVSRPE